MENKYLVGSCLLGLGSNKDIDYAIIVENEDKTYHLHSFENGHDCFFASRSNIEMYMNFEKPFTRKNIFRYVINYQYDADIIKQDFPIEHHIAEKRSDYIRMLNWIVDSRELNFDKDLNFNDWKVSPLLYHVAYLTFILENDSTTLTAEQKAIVQQIHDKQMSVEYLDVLEEKIRNLK